jgi:GTPase SAR1 family protein
VGLVEQRLVYRRRMVKILVTGMSGTGKSTVLEELSRRGHQTVDTDSDTWSESVASDDQGRSSDWVWREDRIGRLLDSHRDGLLYVAGCKSNQGRFYDRFDAVVLLSAPTEMILERIRIRDTNSYGKSASERRMILDDLETVEPLLRATSSVEVDTCRPLSEVVDELVTLGNVLLAGGPLQLARPDHLQGPTSGSHR